MTLPRPPTLLAFLLVFVACSRVTSPDAVSSDPSTKPLPSSPPPAPSPPPVVVAERVCEPTIRCGFWTGCVYLERVDKDRFRALGGSEKGQIFVRRHHCSPPDAGPSGCALYCSGLDAGPPCVDGLSPEHEVCDESAPPRPAKATRCLIGAGICGSLI